MRTPLRSAFQVRASYRSIPRNVVRSTRPACWIIHGLSDLAFIGGHSYTKQREPSGTKPNLQNRLNPLIVPYLIVHIRLLQALDCTCGSFLHEVIASPVLRSFLTSSDTLRARKEERSATSAVCTRGVISHQQCALKISHQQRALRGVISN